MSTLNVNAIQTLSGGKHARVVMSSAGPQVGGSITWHTNFNGSTQNLGNVSGGTDSRIFVAMFGLYYQHNGSTNHGYLSGTYYQTGEDSSTKFTVNLSAHYDWYFNYLEQLLIIPWNPSGTQSLNITNISAYNTSTNNEYRVYQRGFLYQD